MATTLPIQFGTDGWRGIIADNFTFDNVRYAAQATAEYFRTVQGRVPTVFIGFDVRFLSDRFARAAAEVMAGNGFSVQLMDRPYPTPYVSYEVKRQNLVGGVVITASHNPPQFNGFKVKAHFGGSATPAMTAAIEQNLGGEVRTSTEGITIVEPQPHYFDHLRSLVDWRRIQECGLRVVVDSLHGSGGHLLADMLAGTSCTVHRLRCDPDPLFGGIHPEPMMPQLQPLCDEVIRTGAAVGLATDGDADRLGVVSESGHYVDTLRTLSLLLLHTYRNRGWRGAVARTYSQSLLVPRIANALGLELFECPIGFKNIGEIMLTHELLIGGEESGGVGLGRHLPERDGIFVNLMILDMLAYTRKSLNTLIREMWEEFGEFHYDRRDLHVPIEAGKRVVASLAQHAPQEFAGRAVRKVGTLDGSKVFLEGDSWILFRQSGTEPLLRVYCEAPAPGAVQEILGAGLKYVEQISGSGVSLS